MTRTFLPLLTAFCLSLLPASLAGAQPVEPFFVPEEQPAAEGAPAVDAGAEEAAEPAAPGALELAPQVEAEYDLYEDRMQRAMQGSGLGLQFNDANHIRVIATQQVAQPFMNDIRQLEGIIAGNFPEPMKSGVDLRAANIAIFAHRSEWERWVRALFDEFEADGYIFEGMDIEQRMIDSGAFHLEGIYNILLEDRDRESARRSIAFAVGYLYYNQLTLEQGPDALACGFGNLAEEALFQSPSVMVFSGYADRQRAAQAGAWPTTVRQRFQQNAVPSLEGLFRYSTAHMQFPQYAESWSATGMLAGDTDKFCQLILAIRGGADPRQAVFEVYGFDENTFRQAWQQTAGR